MERDSKFQIPKITVLMPVYNCALYVGEAIDSVLNQTFTDYEFLIIDDASTDETVSIINTYTDHRINLIEKPKNTGYTNSLNYGLSIARGEYIARMDGDDICLPERFAKQVAFMDLHPKVVVCGTTYSIIDSKVIKHVPISHEDIKVQLLQKNSFGHPTVMLRKTVLDDNSIIYDTTKEPAEDYDLWVRLLAYGELYNLSEVLLKYRVHDAQVSVNRAKQKFDNYYKIKKQILKLLEAPLTKDENNVLERIIFRDAISYKEFEVFKSIKQKLLEANEEGVFKVSGFHSYIKEMETLMYKDYFLNRKSYFPKLIVHYLAVNNFHGYKLRFRDTYKLFAKSLIFYSK